MGDSTRTPHGTARVNDERFATELAAVWFAANFYYATSWNRGREYIGVVFREQDPAKGRQYGLTVRGDGGFAQSKVTVGDVPRGTVPTAVWHTHIPSDAVAKTLGQQIVMALLTTFDLGWDELSDADRKLADDNSAITMRLFGHPISIYMVTATQIKRYTPGRRHPDKEWKKDPPGRFRPR
jgi:hypothetical protein